MDNEYPNDQESSTTDREQPDATMSRRRFTRAGVTGSVVLGALASKPVLGAAPYQCTVSGQVSGNLSHTTSDSCRIGYKPSYWSTATSWPIPFTKGKLPSFQCAFNPATDRGTNFNGYTAGAATLKNAFYNLENDPPGGGNKSCDVVTTTTLNPATMLQVLSTTTANDYGDFHLGRVVVASLLNAAQFPTTYPISAQRIIAMFNATFPSGSYPVNGTTSWSRAQVIVYLEQLFQL
jgi:hypothetical protein